MTKKDTMTTKTDNELDKLIADTRSELRTERFSAAGARAKDPNMNSKLRRNIARMLTEKGRRISSSVNVA